MIRKAVYFYIISLVLVGCLLSHCAKKEPEVDSAALQAAPPMMVASSEAGDTQIISDGITESRQNAITRAVSSVSPAVVGINVIQIRRYVQRSPFENDPFWNWFFPQREFQERVKGLGSGFLISPEGYILTNEHVVHEAIKIVVTTTDGKQHEAESIGEDMTYDVALLKIKGKDFPYIPMGNSEDVIIGEWVIALGNPFGLFDVSSKPTVTVGVVSATDMDFRDQGRSYQDMIQTDASINGGNSGGPLVNSLGECIGINTFIFSADEYVKGSIGIGFAIPVNRVKMILPDLKNIGRVDRSFQTGLEVENINRLVAMMLGISPRDGVIISRVGRGSPAEEAGLQVGDVIVAMDGQRVRSTSDVQAIINAIDVRETRTLKLTIFRDGELSEVHLELETP